MYVLDLQSLFDDYQMILYPMSRISGLVIAMPVFGTRLVPTQIKVALVLVLTLFVFNTNIQLDSTVLPEISIMDIAYNLVVGLIMGFIITIVFQTFVFGAQIIAMQSGLGFSMLVDPQNGSQVPVVGQLYLIIVTLIFLSIDGHLTLFTTLFMSFEVLPLTVNYFDFGKLFSVSLAANILFTGGVALALPAIISLLIVNLMFGVMTRTAPQMNIFSIGFPMTMILGLVVVYLTLHVILFQFESLLGAGFDKIVEFLGG